MKYGSVCSGIEAATVAWHGLGWKPSFFSEIEDFPRAVLQHHYPDVSLHGDFTTIGENDYGAIDLLVGGTPCQDFSVAGLRQGITGERGNLTLEFIRLAQRKKPKWLVWENVPGVLSIDGGRAFAAFLAGLAECGYGFAYRILDSQHFGVPQRRRRVFVVGYFGDWRVAASVLFEREGLRGDITPRRYTGEGFAPDIAPCLTSGGRAGGIGESRGQDAVVATMDNSGIVGSLCARDHKGVGNEFAESGKVIAIAGNCIDREPHNGGNGLGYDDSGACYTLTKTDRHAVAFHPLQDPISSTDGTTHSLGCGSTHGQASVAVLNNMQVRRLTPVECERLQGFPDNYTLILQTTADGHRYKALGNSMAVPCMKWIGERIQKISTLL